VGNEKKWILGPYFNKIMINATKEPSDTYKKTLKEEISEKFTGKILDMVNQNV
jgi:hypothetical protein